MKSHSLLSRLALAAMLLLATVPTLGRLAMPAPSHAHAHAMRMGDNGAIPAHHHAGDPIAPTPGHAHDCDYCVLLSGALPSAPPAVMAPAAYPRPVAAHQRTLALVDDPGLRGLGARGPPRIS